jgi:hypothetical protein
MVAPPIIDAEFEVISTGQSPPANWVRGGPPPGYVFAPPSSRWTFWGDDFPNLLGIAAMFAMAILLAVLFHRTPADLARQDHQRLVAEAAARAHMTPEAWLADTKARFGN